MVASSNRGVVVALDDTVVQMEDRCHVEDRETNSVDAVEEHGLAVRSARRIEQGACLHGYDVDYRHELTTSRTAVEILGARNRTAAPALACLEPVEGEHFLGMMQMKVE